MAEVVYVLCAITSAVCALLLYLSYRKSRMPLLFWSTLCFVCLSVNNLLLLADLIIAPNIDFSIPRNLAGVAGVGLLLYGALWSRER